MVEQAPEDGVPQSGELIAGRYRVEGHLAAGGMGAVLAAVDQSTQQKVAIKVMLPAAMEIEGSVTRFEREARAAAGIDSEHVVRITDVGTLPSGQPFMVMEHLEGKDLGHLVKGEQPLPETDAVDYVLQACSAMVEAHKQGIVHRDLKPSNLFLTHRADGTPSIKVLDFGISKFSAGSDVLGQNDASLTSTRAMMGSPLYMSPEQVRSAKNVDRRSDIWALGVILYELLTARLPFEADSAGAVCAMIVADEPVPLRWMNKALSEELEAVVMRCLAKEPAERFQDVAELAVALRPFASPIGQHAADVTVKAMEHASGVLPTLHAAPIKLDLPARAAAPPLDKGTVAATPRSMGRASPVSSVPPPPVPAQKRSGSAGRAVALVAISAAIGWGAWTFRNKLAQVTHLPGLLATSDPSSAEGPIAPSADDAAPPEDAAPMVVFPDLDAAADAAGQDASDAMASDDANLDAGVEDADVDELDDGGEEDDDEDEDAGTVAVAPTARPAVHTARPKPKHHVKKKIRRKKR